ncbi:MAG: hypothetical protein ACRDPM_14530, partial [Solirubrobacteraceae bacterium]
MRRLLLVPALAVAAALTAPAGAGGQRGPASIGDQRGSAGIGDQRASAGGGVSVVLPSLSLAFRIARFFDLTVDKMFD